VKIFSVLIAMTMISCSSTPEKTQTTADGNRYTIVCRNEMQDCFHKCEKLCPKGYIVLNRVRGIRVGEQTDYTVIIRCKVR
jgi:hypothetical protein